MIIFVFVLLNIASLACHSQHFPLRNNNNTTDTTTLIPTTGTLMPFSTNNWVKITRLFIKIKKMNNTCFVCVCLIVYYTCSTHFWKSTIVFWFSYNLICQAFIQVCLSFTLYVLRIYYVLSVLDCNLYAALLYHNHYIMWGNFIEQWTIEHSSVSVIWCQVKMLFHPSLFKWILSSFFAKYNKQTIVFKYPITMLCVKSL